MSAPSELQQRCLGCWHTNAQHWGGQCHGTVPTSGAGEALFDFEQCRCQQFVPRIAEPASRGA